MKRLLNFRSPAALLILGALLACHAGNAPALPPAGKPAPARPLHVDGKWIKDDQQKPVTLRGVALADLDAIFKGDRNQTAPTTARDIIDKACGEGWFVDVFRLTVHPEVKDETGSHGWLHYDPQAYFTKILDPVVAHAAEKGKYVIIDWHYAGVSWDASDVVANTEKFWLGGGGWKGIAAAYANNPNVLFELLNEPGQGDWSGWKSRAQGWVDAIRAKGARNIVVVGGPRWSQIMPKRPEELLSGPNIAYACHIYPGHVKEAVPDWIDYVSGVAPVLMTEWGFEKDGPPPVNGTASSYGRLFKAYINARPNVGWTVWCFDSVYRPVTFDTRWVLLGNGQSTKATRFSGGPDDTADNYMGQFLKTWLAECAQARAQQR